MPEPLMQTHDGLSEAETEVVAFLRGELLEAFSLMIRRDDGGRWRVVLTDPAGDQLAAKFGSGLTFDEAWQSLIDFDPGQPPTTPS